MGDGKSRQRNLRSEPRPRIFCSRCASPAYILDRWNSPSKRKNRRLENSFTLGFAESSRGFLGGGRGLAPILARKASSVIFAAPRPSTSKLSATIVTVYHVVQARGRSFCARGRLRPTKITGMRNSPFFEGEPCSSLFHETAGGHRIYGSPSKRCSPRDSPSILVTTARM